MKEKTNSTKARKLISRAMMRVMRTSPFYTTLLLKQDKIEDFSINGMGSNGRELRYNPDVIVNFDNEAISEYLKRIAMKLAHKHHVRMAEQAPRYRKKCEEAGINYAELFNEAADLSVNSLLASGHERIYENDNLKETAIPGRGEYAEMPTLKAAEHYLGLCYQKHVDDPRPPQPQGQGEGPCSDSESGDGDGDGQGEQDKNEDNQGKEPPPQQDKRGESLPPRLDDVAPAKGSTEQAEEQADQDVASAVLAAKQAGEGSTLIDQLIAELEAEPEVNWKAELTAFFSQVVRGRPHYRRPNRRLMDRKIIFANHTDRQTKKIVLLVDESGSMSDESVQIAFREIEEILRCSPSTEVEFVPFDDGVFKEDIVTFNSSNMPIEDNSRKRVGYGGTRFMSAVKYAEEQEPSGIIMLTDMLPCDARDFEAHNPEYPFICLSVLNFQFGGDRGMYQSYGTNPKWCRILDVKP